MERGTGLQKFVEMEVLSWGKFPEGSAILAKAHGARMAP